MGIPELESDIKRNLTATGTAGLPPEVAAYMTNFVWPMFESVTEEMSSMAEAIDELIEQTDDILHQDTAATLAEPLAIALTLATALEQRLGQTPQDQFLRSQVKQLRRSVKAAEALFDQITVMDEPEPEATDGPASEGEAETDDEEGADGDDE